MRDQPFKRYFPSQKKIPKNNYKYPTYQHYYDSKISLTNNKYEEKTNENTKLQDPFVTPTKKGNQSYKTQVKKENKTNLKTELQHLKNQVYRIMEKKQGILRSPIFDKKAIVQKQNDFQGRLVDDSDNQSVSSDKIFGETAKKVELKKMTENADYSKYMELQNNLLKTQLRNLKNKYVSKKKQLTQKCDGLEQKVLFLQNALFKSNDSLIEEISALKIALRQAQNNEKQQNIPTSDKDQESKQLEQLFSRITKLQQQNEDLQRKSIHNITLQQVITNLKAQYQEKIAILLKQKNTAIEQIEERNKENRQLQYEKQYLQSEVQMLKRRIESQMQRHQQVEQEYNKTMQVAQRNHQELIKTLHQQFNNKLLSLTPKKQSIHYSPRQKTKEQDNESQGLRKEIKKWKIQYKILKERYQSYLRMQSESQTEIKDYYRGYQEFKQKNEILFEKNKLFQVQFNKSIQLLSKKDCLLMSKQVEIKNTSDELTILREESNKEIASLKDRCRVLEQKLHQQIQRNQKDLAYRQELQQKILNSQTGDQKLKEALQRTKKRLAEQDEKLSKNVKELKNKESLITKLKKQLRELMQETDKKRQQQIIQQINKIVQDHNNSQQSVISYLKQQFEEERKLMEQSQSKLIDQIQALKVENHQSKKKIVDLTNQLKIVSHAYNTKTIELSNLIANRQQQIQSLHQQLNEVHFTSNAVQASLIQEINMKNQEIMYLRKEVVSKYSISGAMTINGSFDEVLRSQIEGNNKLREESLRKVQEICKMRDNYSSLRSQYENLKSENDINKLKFLSEKNNMEVSYQAEIQNYKNSIDNWEKKIISLQQKIKIFIEENKKKDQFIQQFIMGKKITENQKQILSDFMKQYQISLGSKDIIERLMVEAKSIQNLQKYNYNLLKEIALLKEKLVLFQAIDGQRVSLYQQNISPKSKKSIDQRIQFQENDTKLKKAGSLQDLPNSIAQC